MDGSPSVPAVTTATSRSNGGFVNRKVELRAELDAARARLVAETTGTAEQTAEQRYRAQVRETLRALSDRALAFQDAICRGGYDREEIDAEIARRWRGAHGPEG